MDVFGYGYGYGYGCIRFLEAPAMSEQISRRHRLTSTPNLPDDVGTPAACTATGEPWPNASTDRSGLAFLFNVFQFRKKSCS